MPAVKETGVPTHVIQSLSINYTNATPAVLGQFVDYAGNVVTASTTPIYGPLREDASQGRTVSVGTAGVVEVISGGVFAIGAKIGSDVAGRGIQVGAGVESIGRALSASTAAGQFFQMLITREGTN